jgi:hypothetical protein
LTGKSLKRDATHRHMDIDSIHEGAGYPIPVSGDEGGIAGASVRPLSEESARTGIHGCRQDESRREPKRDLGPCETHVSVLQRLSEGFKNIASVLGEFVKEKHPVMSKAHLPRPGRPPTTHQAGIAHGVVRGPERPVPQQGFARGQNTSHGVDPGHLHGFLEREGRENSGQPACQHRLSGPGGAEKKKIVAAGRRYLQGPLYVPLPPDFSQVSRVSVAPAKDLSGVD